MKVKDRRNHNKTKITRRIAELREEQKLYSQPHGPYRVVSIVSLGGECGKALGECNGLFYSEKHRMNFLFRCTDGMNEFQTGYACRSSDVVVFFINTADVDENRLSIVKRFVPSCLFCIESQGLRGAAKKTVARHFPKERIVEMSGLVDALAIMKMRSTSVCRRPYIVPTRIHVDGEYVYAEGFLKSGLLSDRVVVNGKYSMVIEEVAGERVYLGCELNGDGKIENAGSPVEDEEIPEESLMSACSEECSMDSGSGCDVEDEEEPSEGDQESLIDKYTGYRGIRNFSTCEFRSHNFPSHYKDLLFFDDFRRAEKLVVGRESVIPDNQMVRIKLRYEGLLDEEISVIFGCYEYEDRETIFNFHFDSEAMLTEEPLIVDFGHRAVEVSPMLTKSLNQKVFKRRDELDSGVVSFIAPMAFNVSRVLIYRKSALAELSSNTFASVGLNGFVGDREIFDEAVLKGVPTKTKKRYSLIKKMFNTKEEVMYFRNVQLHMRNRKVTGFVKKPIGTHGLFKGYFTQPIKSGDQVLMSLYKRVFLSRQ